jgi:glutathione S-transferase
VSLTLYDYELSAAAYKVRLFLALLGVPYAKRAVDVFPGLETRSAAFLALNPRGTVPVLVDDALTIIGAEAILCHFAAKHDPAGVWLPRDESFATVMSWLFFATSELAVAEAARLEELLRIPSPIENARVAARQAFRVLDDHLVRQSFRDVSFLTGPHPTIADIAAFPAVALGSDFGCFLDEFPKLRTWTRRIRALPGFISMPGIPEYL